MSWIRTPNRMTVQSTTQIAGRERLGLRQVYAGNERGDVVYEAVLETWLQDQSIPRPPVVLTVTVHCRQNLRKKC